MRTRVLSTLTAVFLVVTGVSMAGCNPGFLPSDGDLMQAISLEGQSGKEWLRADGNENPAVLPPQSTPYGLTYGEWSARFWQWLFSMPVDSHPLFDTADCSEGQSGPVWFLGGTFTVLPSEDDPDVFIGEAERDCTVPVGKTIFVTIINAECSDIEGDGETEESLRGCANFLMDHLAEVRCEIDGVPVENLESYRVESPLFEIGPLPADNTLGVAEGTTGTAVSDGIHLMLPPMSRGQHTIEFFGKLAFPEFEFTFILDITYNLTVVDNG